MEITHWCCFTGAAVWGVGREKAQASPRKRHKCLRAMGPGLVALLSELAGTYGQRGGGNGANSSLCVCPAGPPDGLGAIQKVLDRVTPSQAIAPHYDGAIARHARRAPVQLH